MQQVYASSDLYGLDALAVFANALLEGLHGGIGDDGRAYGPWQDHLTQYPERPWYGYGRDNEQVNAWAWSAAGIDYSLRQMRAGGAAGLTGHAAVEQIVEGYEQPADKPRAKRDRDAVYDDLKARGGQVGEYLAAQANGPAGGGPAGPPILPTVPPPLVVAPAVGSTPSTAWHAWRDFLTGRWPQAGTAASKAATRLTVAVHSKLR